MKSIVFLGKRHLIQAAAPHAKHFETNGVVMPCLFQKRHRNAQIAKNKKVGPTPVSDRSRVSKGHTYNLASHSVS